MPEHPRALDGVPWSTALDQLEVQLQWVFGELWACCTAGEDCLDHRPGEGAWSGREVLEHVHLADGFLLLLARKIAAKSERRMQRGSAWPETPPAFEWLEHIVERELRWQHPVHMTPAGGASLTELSAGLQRDLDACLRVLRALPAGAGTLHRIKMSVVGPEARLDLYQYLDVIALHAERHLRQLRRCRESFQAAQE